MLYQPHCSSAHSRQMDIEGKKADESNKVRHWKTILNAIHEHPRQTGKQYQQDDIIFHRSSIPYRLASLSSTDNTFNTHMWECEVQLRGLQKCTCSCAKFGG
mmetsp:Transcript_17482/g.43581  ORF Transcript_17482/g.43581 Transcript_17482/m.43581 type:complete len:102 (+) Transcript_17482:173-478(+)